MNTVDIENLTNEISAVYEKYIGAHHRESDTPSFTPVNSEGIDIEERLRLAYASKSGPKIQRLMAGEISEYNNNHSDADLALLMHLAFWMNNDPALMQTAFEKSALAQREKWRTRKDYRERTIRMACKGTKEVYQPHRKPELPNVLFEIDQPGETTVTGEKNRDDIDRTLEALDTFKITKMECPPVSYWTELPFFPKDSIIAVTGEAGSGKSTFVEAELIEVANAHPDARVIYCDADNPSSIAKERMQRLLGGAPDNICYWGGFCADAEGRSLPPWQMEDARWIPLIDRSVAGGKKPIIVFDTLNSFMCGENENDNAVVGRLMVALRTMNHHGATVIVIHHTGKSQTSKESRGASAFKGGVDCAWLVDSTIVDCTITAMSVTAWKSRLGKTEPYMYHVNEQGKLVRNESASSEDMVIKFIADNPGMTKNELEKQAKKSNQRFSRSLLRDAITKGVMSQKLKISDGKYYVNEAHNND